MAARALDEVFAGNGALARLLSGYRERDQQRAMADRVASAIAESATLVCEAGTGTGKTLAYLLPALASGIKTIVSTGTRTLQEQLFYRDLPLACDALARRPRCAMLKGRSNYLCLQRMHAHLDGARPGRLDDVGYLEAIRAWSARTSDGDISGLGVIPETAAVWRYATSTRDNCLGARCPRLDDCYVFEARRRAASADVLVINHHLLLAHLALEEAGRAELLPAADVLIVDEAHQLPDLATQFFAVTLGDGQLLELAADCELAQRTEARDEQALEPGSERLRSAARDFRLALGSERRRVAWADLAQEPGVADALERLAQALSRLTDALDHVAERGALLASCAQRAAMLSKQLIALRVASDSEHLSWLETRTRGFTWRRSPLEVGGLLGPMLAARFPAVVLTSATLAVAGDLDHFVRRIGIAAPRCEVFESPFDHARQALLYVPQDMPPPRSEHFAAATYRVVTPVLKASGGRAFVLFTSHGALARARSELAPTLPYPVFVQGDAPRADLLDRFRESGDGVLLGTYSFWEGVDVRGEALSCVIIDKLPFAPPNDPLLRAREEALRARGEDPFSALQLPQAAIALKQGIGRLLRDDQDRGVVVICDSRLMERGYGRWLMRSLPPMTLTRELAQVEAFFEVAS